MIGKIGKIREPAALVGAATPLNRATWGTTVILGITLAVAGLHHGFFELLQGNRPTPGPFIASIGPEQVRWEHGTDGAFTLIPNFLATGLAAMAVSLAIVAWCVYGLRGRYGARGFVGLFVLLTLVGGGIGHAAFFLLAGAWATRIRGGLGWWRRALRPGARRALRPVWLPALATSSLLFLLALELSVFGPPGGAADPDGGLALIAWVLLGSLAALNVAYVAAIARDLEPAGAKTGRAAAARMEAG